MAQLVEALHYKPEGRGFDSRMYHWNFYWHNSSDCTMAPGLYQHHSSWRNLPGHRHGKLFIGRPCKKRANDLLNPLNAELNPICHLLALLWAHTILHVSRINVNLSRHQLKMVVAILTGHVTVRGHLYTMGLFDGDPTCRFCRKETETVLHIICCCEALACQRCNVFGNPFVEPKDISTASVRNLCLFIRGTRLLNVYWLEYLGLHNKLKAEVHPGHKVTGPKEKDMAPGLTQPLTEMNTRNIS